MRSLTSRISGASDDTTSTAWPWLAKAAMKSYTCRLAPSSMPRNLQLEEVGEGIYQAALTLPEAGAWYLHVQSPSLGRRFAEENYTSLRVLPATTSNASETDVRNLR